MKKIFIISYLIIISMLLIISSFGFTLNDQDIYPDAVKYISELNKEPVTNSSVCDSLYENSSESFILKASFSDKPDKYYAFSYLKHPVLPFYKRTFYADYSIKDFGGILLAEGFPYNSVYDISSYQLVYKDRHPSNLIITLISCTVIFIVLFLMLCILRYAKHK